MLTRLRSYSLLLALAFLFSCQFEKRLYRGGYYISSRKEIKTSTTSPQEQSTVPAPESEIKCQQNDPPTKITAQKQNDGPEKIAQTNTCKKNLFRKKPAAKTVSSKQSAPTPHQPDEDGVKKDVKTLLKLSVATLLASLIYGAVLISKLYFLIDLFFILTPFAIIGAWILALLLFTKYTQEAQAAAMGKPALKERIITKHKAYLFAGILGIFGAHRFYLGYTWMGILEMLTLGGLGILFFIDFIRIKRGKLKPKKGDYDQEQSTYRKSEKKLAPNRSQKLIKLAVLISLIALLTLLSFAVLV